MNKNKHQLLIKNIKKVTSAIILMNFIFIQVAALPRITVAYAFDKEEFINNSFGAGILDATLRVQPFTDNASNNKISKSQPLYSTITINAPNVIPGDYVLKTSVNSIDQDEYDQSFCNALNLKIVNNTASLSYTAPVASFSTDTLNLHTVNSWNAMLYLSSSSEDFYNAACDFSFNLDSYQKPSSSFSIGFSDKEASSLEIQAVEETNINQISPIQDTTLDHSNPNTNFGNSATIQIKSQSQKEKRGLISFQYRFPDNLEIYNANLVATLKNAPISNRLYKLNRIEDSWDENTATWNNQPSTTPTSIAGVQTGTIDNTTMIWDTTSDVQDLITKGLDHHGWTIYDSDEQASKSITGSFYSRKATELNFRPHLDITFKVPVINTTHPVINEVYYDVASSKGGRTLNEWVEIYNPTGSSVDISGWRICDNAGCDTLPNGTPVLPPHGFAVISDSPTTWTTYWNMPPAAILIPLNNAIGSNGLSNSGDSVILKDASNTILDAISYGNDTSILNPSIPLTKKGFSIARIIKGFDNDTARDFIVNIAPNPGTNPSEGGVEKISIYEDGFEMAPSVVPSSVEPVGPLLNEPGSDRLSSTAINILTTPELLASPTSINPIASISLTTTISSDASPSFVIASESIEKDIEIASNSQSTPVVQLASKSDNSILSLVGDASIASSSKEMTNESNPADQTSPATDPNILGSNTSAIITEEVDNTQDAPDIKDGDEDNNENQVAEPQLAEENQAKN